MYDRDGHQIDLAKWERMVESDLLTAFSEEASLKEVLRANIHRMRSALMKQPLHDKTIEEFTPSAKTHVPWNGLLERSYLELRSVLVSERTLDDFAWEFTRKVVHNIFRSRVASLLDEV